jgi:cell division transport system permease protein
MRRGAQKRGAGEGAKIARRGAASRYRAWVRHHRASAADSLQRILEHPVSSLLTWLVVGIAMALPVGLLLALDNLRGVEGQIDDQASLSVFLDTSLDETAARGLARAISERTDVAGVIFTSRTAALEEFQRESGFADVLQGLEANPLPHLLLVTPRQRHSLEASDALAAALSGQDGVAEVVVDSAWLRRLQGILRLGARMAWVLGALLCAGVILVLGNTIRLAIENRREEILVTRLVGGSDAFVRRPFLYTGLWYGVGGGIAAGLLVLLALWLLSDPVAALAAAYGAEWQLRGPGAVGLCQMVLAGGLLGLASAWVAVSRHLRGMEPA